MNRILTSLSLAAFGVCAANAQVYINEVLANSPGGDTGLELFELRGTPNLSLSGFYLLSIEGQGNPGSRGDVNQFFDLGNFSLGANGYLFARQANSPYVSVAAGATLIENTIGTGWGTNANNTVGHLADGNPNQLDLENSATTILLINIGAGAAPALTTDVDTDNDGLLDLPAGWSVVDSVGIMDGVGGLASDVSFGAITLRAGGVGSAAVGSIIDVSPTSGSNLYVARVGESTGSTAGDWFGAILSGSGGNYTFSTVSDPFYAGRNLSEMVFGGANPVPEPTTLTFAGLGALAVWAMRRRQVS